MIFPTPSVHVFTVVVVANRPLCGERWVAIVAGPYTEEAYVYQGSYRLSCECGRTYDINIKEITPQNITVAPPSASHNNPSAVTCQAIVEDLLNWIARGDRMPGADSASIRQQLTRIVSGKLTHVG